MYRPLSYPLRFLKHCAVKISPLLQNSWGLQNYFIEVMHDKLNYIPQHDVALLQIEICGEKFRTLIACTNQSRFNKSPQSF